MNLELKKPNPKAVNEEVQASTAILRYTYESSGNFLQLFKKSREPKMGSSTDQEQDLLRAMLLFATAGLDAMVKRLVNDAIQYFAQYHNTGKSEFEQFIFKVLKSKDSLLESSETPKLDIRLLANLLSAESPCFELIEKFKQSLTSSSLQSKDELFRVAKCFGIEVNILTNAPDELRRIFKIRNEIVHEMDIKLEQKNRKRRHRRCQEMVNNTSEILRIAEVFLMAVDNRLTPLKNEMRKRPRHIYIGNRP